MHHEPEIQNDHELINQTEDDNDSIDQPPETFSQRLKDRLREILPRRNPNRKVKKKIDYKKFHQTGTT